jgi:prepilin-type N-terminal cleavage/methylation domain-containing protein
MSCKKPKKLSKAKKTRKQKGFTLIELLVVIAIIGLLSTLAVFSLSAARSKARDTKRLSDIRNIQSALELYASEHGVYPTQYGDSSISADGQNIANSCLDRDKQFQPSGCSNAYMIIPPGPLANDQYIYRVDSNGLKYALEFKLEAKTRNGCATPEQVKEEMAAGEKCTP